MLHQKPKTGRFQIQTIQLELHVDDVRTYHVFLPISTFHTPHSTLQSPHELDGGAATTQVLRPYRYSNWSAQCKQDVACAANRERLETITIWQMDLV